MRTALTTRRGLYVVLPLCCAGAIYFYPFLSSSISWMRKSQFRYENRTPVSLPFRWVSGEGGGLVLVKPAAAITSSPLLDTRFTVHDSGPDFKPSDQGRARLLHEFRGTPNELTDPFTSAGLICSRVDPRSSSDFLIVSCLSTDFRYSLLFMGMKEYIPEASEIARQVVR
jgi:hypothetical protein